MNRKNKSPEERYRSFREEYNPLRKGRPIKILFVAESPPKPKKGKLPYFYNKDSKGKGLWWYFNEALYGGKIDEKGGFLERFRDDGYFLIDIFSTRKELDELREKGKKADYDRLTRINQRLFERIEKLKPEKVVLLGKRSIKLVAGCLPFGNNTNVEEFKRFVKSSVRNS